MAENFMVSEYQQMKRHLLEDLRREIDDVKPEWLTRSLQITAKIMREHLTK